MKIEIEKTKDRRLECSLGRAMADHLTEGEALEVVARIILTGYAPYLKTDLQHLLWNLKYDQGEIRALLP